MSFKFTFDKFLIKLLKRKLQFILLSHYDYLTISRPS